MAVLIRAVSVLTNRALSQPVVAGAAKGTTKVGTLSEIRTSAESAPKRLVAGTTRRNQGLRLGGSINRLRRLITALVWI